MTGYALLKVTALLAALGLSVLASLVLRRQPASRRWALAVLGFLPFAGLHAFSISFLVNDWYRGDSAGLEFTAIDCIVLALWLALPGGRPGPFRAVRWLYFTAVLLALPFAPVPLYSLFSVWKLLRMFALVTVVARACEDVDAPPVLLRGIGLGALFQGLLALDQHFRLHRYQAVGAFDHQNTLGMACTLVAPISLAIVLARPGRRLAWAALGGGLLAVLLSLSRGSLVMILVALAAVFCASAARELTWRKVGLGAGALLAAAGVALRVWNTWSDRFLNAPKASAEGRVLFERAASMMADDHPLGLGLNQFSWALEHLGYAQRAGITGYDTRAVVHNIYWLTAAELGWPGLAAYLLLLAAPLWMAASAGLRAKGDLRGDVLLGCAAGLLATYLHGTLEWVARQTAFAYLFWTLAALVAALAHQLREEHAVPSRRAVLLHGDLNRA